jgi:hypothetical protein
MAYNYTQFVTAIAELMVVPTTDPDFQTVLPNIIDDGEQRIYRETDLLATIIRDPSGALAANSRNFTFPQHMVVLESLNVFTIVGITSTGRKQLVQTSREFLDAMWPNETAPSIPSVPTYYAMITDQTIIVGAPPDAAYNLEVVGTIRPTPLSATNPTTYLSLYLPDLFLAACMVFAAGYQQNFSSMSDNPAQSVSWESHYQELLESQNIEELRKKYASQAWTAKQPTPLATPPRA